MTTSTCRRWLKPETAAERIWLRGGALHVVPPPSAHQPTLPATPTTVQALQILQSPVETLAPSRMQARLLSFWAQPGIDLEGLLLWQESPADCERLRPPGFRI